MTWGTLSPCAQPSIRAGTGFTERRWCAGGSSANSCCRTCCQVMQLTEGSSQTLPIVDRHFSVDIPSTARHTNSMTLSCGERSMHFISWSPPTLRRLGRFWRSLPPTRTIAPSGCYMKDSERRGHDTQTGLRPCCSKAITGSSAGMQRIRSGPRDCSSRPLRRTYRPNHSWLSKALVMDLRPSWQRTVGWASFTLLSGMDEERLSTTARRRLGELRRRFNMEQPPAPVGVQSRFVGPPIPPRRLVT